MSGHGDEIGDSPPGDRQLFDQCGLPDIGDARRFGFDDSGTAGNLDGGADSADAQFSVDAPDIAAGEFHAFHHVFDEAGCAHPDRVDAFEQVGQRVLAGVV